MRLTIKVRDEFNIEQTMECGQCFNFEKIGEMEYAIVSGEKFIHVKHKNDELIFLDSSDEDIDYWIHYFDLNRDYSEIKEFLLKKENKLREAITAKSGIRLLNQEFYETLISYIISQNKQITQIKQIVRTISEKYGRCIGEVNGREYYSFPDINILGKITESDYRECKTGFRAPYLYNASSALCSGVFADDAVTNMNKEETKQNLLSIKGVGEKVANCVMLFGLGYRDLFPVDVWIKRIMEEMYFGREASIPEISELATEKFGEYGGYAQQYLFYYGRENKIGKKISK